MLEFFLESADTMGMSKIENTEKITATANEADCLAAIWSFEIHQIFLDMILPTATDDLPF